MVKFKVFANARFLSHAEILRVFQRACARARLDVAYSSGYNPRPEIALPLPKSVGLACEDEICALRLKSAEQVLDTEKIKVELNDQLTEGIELIGAESSKRRISFNKGTAVYEFSINPQQCNEQLKERVAQLLAADSLKLMRRLDARGRTKTVDVRQHLQSVEIQGFKVIVKAGFGPQGSIRIDEILSLLGLDVDSLDGPVTRTKVLWNSISDAQQFEVGNN